MTDNSGSEDRRARALGIAPGVFPPGPLNAITDVDGVRVGQIALVEGSDIRTGATAFSALHPVQVGADVQIDFGSGDVLTIHNTKVSTLSSHQGDFLFH